MIPKILQKHPKQPNNPNNSITFISMHKISIRIPTAMVKELTLRKKIAWHNLFIQTQRNTHLSISTNQSYATMKISLSKINNMQSISTKSRQNLSPRQLYRKILPPAILPVMTTKYKIQMIPTICFWISMKNCSPKSKSKECNLPIHLTMNKFTQGSPFLWSRSTMWQKKIIIKACKRQKHKGMIMKFIHIVQVQNLITFKKKKTRICLHQGG